MCTKMTSICIHVSIRTQADLPCCWIPTLHAINMNYQNSSANLPFPLPSPLIYNPSPPLVLPEFSNLPSTHLCPPSLPPTSIIPSLLPQSSSIPTPSHPSLPPTSPSSPSLSPVSSSFPLSPKRIQPRPKPKLSSPNATSVLTSVISSKSFKPPSLTVLSVNIRSLLPKINDLSLLLPSFLLTYYVSVKPGFPLIFPPLNFLFLVSLSSAPTSPERV